MIKFFKKLKKKRVTRLGCYQICEIRLEVMFLFENYTLVQSKTKGRVIIIRIIYSNKYTLLFIN